MSNDYTNTNPRTLTLTLQTITNDVYKDILYAIQRLRKPQTAR